MVEETALAGPFSDYCVFVIVSISKLRNPTARILRTWVKTS